MWIVAAVLTAPSTACRAADKNALPDDVLAVLEKADKLEVLSIDPTPARRTAVREGTTLYGYTILGQTALTDAKARGELLDALKKGIAANDGVAAACFNPRHALRATHEKKTVEVVICFECLSMQYYVDGKRIGSVLTTRSPKGAFDKVLADAKAP
jgi:hypothetical protein